MLWLTNKGAARLLSGSAKITRPLQIPTTEWGIDIGSEMEAATGIMNQLANGQREREEGKKGIGRVQVESLEEKPR